MYVPLYLISVPYKHHMFMCFTLLNIA